MARAYTALLCCAFFTLAAAGLCAQETTPYGHNLSFGVSTGILYGRGEEIIWRENEQYLSQLVYDVKPLLYAGLGAAYRWRGAGKEWGLFAEIEGQFGFPAASGIMEDRDWEDETDARRLTKYSVHDNKTSRAILADLNLGFSFFLTPRFTLKPYLSYGFMFFSWEATGGYFLYDPQYLNSGSNPLPRPRNETVLTYEQIWHILSPAVSVGYAMNRFFYVEAGIKASPFLLCFSTDQHILRNLTVTTMLLGGVFFEVAPRISFKPHKSFELSLSVSFRTIFRTQGDAEYDGLPDIEYLRVQNAGGAGYTMFDIGLFARWVYSTPQPVVKQTNPPPAPKPTPKTAPKGRSL